MGSEAEKDFADENMALHWIDRYAAGIDDYPQLDLIAEALAPGAASEVLCHRLHTPTGKWMWMDGPPSQGALDDAMNFGWKMEYAYADRLAASLPVSGADAQGTELARQFEYWLRFNKECHARDGNTVHDDMPVIAPEWPSRGVLKIWIAIIRRLAASPSGVGGDT